MYIPCLLCYLRKPWATEQPSLLFHTYSSLVACLTNSYTMSYIVHLCVKKTKKPNRIQIGTCLECKTPKLDTIILKEFGSATDDFGSWKRNQWEEKKKMAVAFHAFLIETTVYCWADYSGSVGGKANKKRNSWTAGAGNR